MLRAAGPQWSPDGQQILFVSEVFPGTADDEANKQAAKAVKEGTFTGGVQQFGLAENGVGYVYDANNKALIPDAVRATLNALTADIIAGRITVPSTRPGTK